MKTELKMRKSRESWLTRKKIISTVSLQPIYARLALAAVVLPANGIVVLLHHENAEFRGEVHLRTLNQLLGLLVNPLGRPHPWSNLSS